MRHTVNNLLHGVLGRRGGDALSVLLLIKHPYYIPLDPISHWTLSKVSRHYLLGTSPL
jgi:hypothetical protein